MMDIHTGHDFHSNGMGATSSDLDISFDIHRKNNYLYRHPGSSHHVPNPYPEGISVVTPTAQDFRLDTSTHSSHYNGTSISHGHDSGLPSKSHHGRQSGKQRLALLTAAEDAALEREARSLIKRWERCPGYQQYRKRQPKDEDENKQKVWPPHIELAFCKALILFPPMGRKQMLPVHGQKPMGRNELIAWAIEKWTGEVRDRKKVSSHIQVLRPMFDKHRDEDPGLMEYFSTPTRPPTGRRGCRAASQAMSRHRQFSNHPRANSSQYRYPNGTTSTSSTSTGSSVSVHLPPPDDVQDVCRYPPAYFSFAPTKFEMFVKQREKQMHLFTKCNRDCQGPDILLDDIYHLRFHFPPLARELEHGALESQILFNNARIGLAADSIPNGPDSTENELGVFMVLDCDSKHLSMSEHLNHYFGGFRARTRFYDSGKLIADVPEKSDRDQLDHTKPTYDMDNKTLGNVHFGSVFWAERVYQLGRVLRDAAEKRAAGTIAGDEVARSLEQRVSDSIKRLSAVQEIFAVSRDNWQERRILAICWKFEHVMSEPCYTTWRHVVAGHQDILMGTDGAKAEETLESKLASSLQEAFSQGADTHADGHPNAFDFDMPDETDPFNSAAHPNYGASPHFDLTDMASQLPIGLQHNLVNLPSTASEEKGMVDSSLTDHNLYPSNHIDFSGGHINICMPEADSMMEDTHGTAGLPPLDLSMSNDGIGVDLHGDVDLNVDLDSHFAVTSAGYPSTLSTHQSHDLLPPFEDGVDTVHVTDPSAMPTTTAAELDRDVRAWACNGFPYFDMGLSAAPSTAVQFVETGTGGVDGALSRSPRRDEETEHASALLKLEELSEEERMLRRVSTPVLHHPQPVMMQTGGGAGMGFADLLGSPFKERMMGVDQQEAGAG